MSRANPAPTNAKTAYEISAYPYWRPDAIWPTLFLGQFFYEGETPDRAFFSREKVDSILEYDKALVGFIADLAAHALLKIKADEIIRESEQKFHAVFDQAYQFLGLLSVDGRVLEANKTVLSFGDVDKADVIGLPFWETPWWSHSPELQENVRLAVLKAEKGELIGFEASHPDSEGRLHYVDFSLKPVKDDAGEVIMLIAEGRDISCNKAFEKFYGILRAQIAGKTVYEIAPKEMADVYHSADETLFRHPGMQIYEGCIQSTDGVRHTVMFHKATFTGLDGVVAGLVGAVVDITEQKRAEKSLQESEAKTRGILDNNGIGVAHDFNNMLSVILGHTELALADMDPAQPIFSALQEIQKAAGRSADLTGQLLAFARKQTVSPRILNLNETVEGMLRMLRRLIGEDVDLAWLPGKNQWPVKLDPSQIDQILVNLCINARDAIMGVGKVTIEMGNETLDQDYCDDHPGFIPGDFVMMAVSDNGHGMDKDILDNIFEPFSIQALSIKVREVLDS